MSSYCVATKPAPLLNRPDFQKVFGSQSLPLDDKGLLRCLETIALPGTKFEVHQEIDPYTLEVSTKDYPYGKCFVDSRFVMSVSEKEPEREKILPSVDKIVKRLNAALGLPYVWGGNWSLGIPEILSIYKPPVAQEQRQSRMLCGLDCSGLLYEATDGYTPRNTSELIHFGKEVQSPEPLDLLIYPGHVIIMLDQNSTIESLYGHGVILDNFEKRIEKLKKTGYFLRRFL